MRERESEKVSRENWRDIERKRIQQAKSSEITANMERVLNDRLYKLKTESPKEASTTSEKF